MSTLGLAQRARLDAVLTHLGQLTRGGQDALRRTEAELAQGAAGPHRRAALEARITTARTEVDTFTRASGSLRKLLGTSCGGC